MRHFFALREQTKGRQAEKWVMWNKRNSNNSNSNSKESQKPARVRIALVQGVPKLHDIRMLLVEAERNKGVLCELPIRGLIGMFLLSCQSDYLSPEPCWTLYEGEDGAKQLWSYINNDLDMITDITSMSVMNKDTKTEVNLGPATTGGGAAAGGHGGGGGLGSQFPRAAQSAGMGAQQGGGAGQAAGAQGPAPASAPVPAEPSQFAASADQAGGWPTTQASGGSQWGSGVDNSVAAGQQGAQWTGAQPQETGWPQADPATSGNWPNPQSQGGGGWPAANPEMNPQLAPGFSQASAPLDPSGNAWGAQQQQGQQWNAQAPAPAPASAPIPAANPWGAAAAPTQAPLANDSIWNANKTAAAPSDNPWRTGDTSHGGNNAADTFIRSLEGRPNITISELTMDPALPPNCVDAVLKLQEMVLKGHFSEKKALEALKLAAMNRGVLDEGILNKVQARGAAGSDEHNRQAAQILQQSGLITELDLANAETAAPKHGGDVGAALIASGKIDQLILEAAQRGQELTSKGSLRPDQIIIALHYCQRMRAKLDDALSDLNIDIL